MDTLHAPWRISYILAPKPPATGRSIFTSIAQSSDDEKNLVVWRDKLCFVILNAYPYTGGHMMVIPYRQVSDLWELTGEEMQEMMRLAARAQTVLRKTMRADGFNIGINIGQSAGAGVLDHLHMHIVPRWSGDTNFMPVIANASVVPQALEEICGKLRTAFQLEV